MSRKTFYLAAIIIAGLLSAVITPAIAGDDGATMFKAKCAMCHGQDATGKTPMGSKLNIRDLTSADVQKQSDEEIAGVIAKGRNKMPEYGTKLTKEQITDLEKYVRSIGKK